MTVMLISFANRRRVRQALVSGAIRPTRCAGGVVAARTISKSHNVRNVDTPHRRCVPTTGPLRPRGGRPPELAACVTLRLCAASSRTDSGRDFPSLKLLPPSKSYNSVLYMDCITVNFE